MVKAVIDVGSNSVLLTVAEKQGANWRSVYESSEVTALGEGVKQTGVLSEESMERTLAAIRRGFDAAQRCGADSVVCAATMAARIANNTEEFLNRAEHQGTPTIVLSGDDEARLGFLAVANDPTFEDSQRISIIDPGGHSTELVTAERDPVEPIGWRLEFKRSFPIGTLAMLGDVFSAERPDIRAQLNACRQIDDAIGMAYRPNECGTIVTLGATGTNLVSIRESMPEWSPERVHGAYLDYEEISKSVSWLSEMTIEQRSRIVGMEPGRERTLHAGALILERFIFAIRGLGAYVSVRGWRHALLEESL